MTIEHVHHTARGKENLFTYEMQHFHTYLILAELHLTLKCHSHRLSPFFTIFLHFAQCVCVCVCLLGVVLLGVQLY